MEAPAHASAWGPVAVNTASFIDYPGLVSTVLFMPGCNLRCPYCQNADIVTYSDRGQSTGLRRHGREEVEAILATTKWAAALPELHLPKPGTHPTAFVIILQDSDIQPNMQAAMIDVGIAAQTITLAATETGLGCLMIRNFGLKPLTEVLGLSESLVPVLVIAIGAPAEKIELVPVLENGDVNYYRDENGTHYVPKRALEDIVLEKE